MHIARRQTADHPAECAKKVNAVVAASKRFCTWIHSTGKLITE
jgi:hypothetical protein